MALPRINVNLLPANSETLTNILQRDNILGVIEFSDGKGKFNYKTSNSGFPYLSVHMKPFLHDTYYEVWTSNQEVSYGKENDLQYATDGYHFFSTISMKENQKGLSDIGKSAYDSIFDSIKKYNHPYISKIWNYVPYINEFSNDSERYKLFCHGRAVAFQNNGEVYPAATGIGCFGDNVNIYFLSLADNSQKNIENPNQTPAFKYPSTYGIKPPSFARGTYSEYSQEINSFYVSGTASILGHETVFKGDIKKQCETTIKNIETLISQSNLQNYGINQNYSLNDLDCIKVYVKNEEDFPIVQNICMESFSSNNSIAYLKADICRNDLLVEIDGLITKQNNR